MIQRLILTLTTLSFSCLSALSQTDDYWKVPVRDHGFEFGIEADKAFGETPIAGGGLTLGYKINPKISLDFGLAFGMSDLDAEYHQWVKQYNEQHSWGVTIGNGSTITDDGYKKDEHRKDVYLGLFSLRGTYRFSDARFSPIASLALSYRLNTDGGKDMWGTGRDPRLSVKKSGFVVTPAIGASMRINQNTYLEARIGYHIGSNTASAFSYTDERGVGTSNHYETHYEYPSIASRGLTLGLAWKHTFGYTPEPIKQARRERAAARAEKWGSFLGFLGGMLEVTNTAMSTFSNAESTADGYTAPASGGTKAAKARAKHPCKACSGTGKCRKCRGSGKYYNTAGKGDEGFRWCPNCNPNNTGGKDKGLCSVCHGSGTRLGR